MAERIKHALLFPGQGSQKPGMGWELYQKSPTAQQTFKAADEICRQLDLGFSITKVCFEDPHNQLTGETADTSVIQPALLTVSVATARHLREQGVPPAKIHLGHSLGKYSALVASGSLELVDALHYVTQRGVVMKEAQEDLKAMVGSVIGLDYRILRRTLRSLKRRLGLGERDPFFHPSVVNARFHSMIVGPRQYWEYMSPALKEAGARVSPYLNAPPSHHPIMERAQQKLNELGIKLSKPHIPILDDVSSRVMRTVEQVEVSIGRHLIAPVVWRANLAHLRKRHIVNAIEIGPGEMLKNMAKREHPELTVYTTGSWEEVEQACQRFAKQKTTA